MTPRVGTSRRAWIAARPRGPHGTAVSTKTNAEERYANQLESSLNALLLRTVGPNKAQVKVKADLTTRSHVLETVQLFRAKVVDVAPDAVTIEATGTADKLEALIRVLEPFGIKELVQSGMVAVGRGSRSITDRNNLRPVERTA